jgi:tRNA pseudouridine55 synthase
VNRARGDSGLDGFLNICKPAGPTSHDVVAMTRRLLGTRRIGHAGTLDPLGEGVLPLAIGRATRLLDELSEADKAYYAEAVLGLRTSTDDADGETLKQRPVPKFTLDELDQAIAEFLGKGEQVPPAFSALKIQGRRAYALARKGYEIKLESRPITIYEIQRRHWDWPVLSFSVRCSKGTYIRALARDLGERLGVGASLRRLIRLRVGPFDLRDAIGLDDLRIQGSQLVVQADALALARPAVVLGQHEHEHLRHGRAWRSADGCPALARAYTFDGHFAALLACDAGRWRSKLAFLD